MTTDQLTTAQTSITQGVATLSGILNLAAGPTAIAGFVAEGIFKAIKIGVGIHQAQQTASADLDTKIRAMDVVRLPVSVNLDLLALQSFYSNGVNLRAFPSLTQQFAAEIQEFRDKGGNPSAATTRILSVAKDLVSALTDDPGLTANPELADLFLIGLDPTRSTLRDIVLAYVALFPRRALPYRQHYDRLGDFWKSQLTISLGAIKQAQLDAQQTLNTNIRDLVNKAIFDSTDGALGATLGLAKTLKGAAIDQQIADLTAKQAEATGQDATDLNTQIAALKAWKAKLS